MNKVLADTSVLVAAVVKDHPKHQECLQWLQKAKQGKIHLFISSHSLAECYATLTKLPLSPRIPPNIAHHIIQENFKGIATIIDLKARDYYAVLNSCKDINLSGGIVSDALIFKAAIKAKVDKLITLNPKDFRIIAKKQSELIYSV